MRQEDLDEVKADVERAFKAALFSTDYCILRIIIDTSKESRSAYEKQDYQSMIYSINKGFWDIGICIDRKLKSYSSVTPEFFDDISSNVKNQLKTALYGTKIHTAISNKLPFILNKLSGVDNLSFVV